MQTLLFHWNIWVTFGDVLVCLWAAVAGDNPLEATKATSATFLINNTKLHDPVITLSIKN